MKFSVTTSIAVKSAVLGMSLCLSALPALRAQSQSSLEAISNREIVRRQENVAAGEKLVSQGDQAMAEKDYENAYLDYMGAVNNISAGQAVTGERDRALEKFSAASVAYAEYLIANGRYADAEKVAKTVLLPEYNPNYKPAVALLSHLEQSNYYNKTVTPKFADDRNEVTTLLLQADGFCATGRFDLATKRYEQVLNIDPYNIAARRGMEQVNHQKDSYYESAYNETRSRLLWTVGKAWETPYRKFQGHSSDEFNETRTIDANDTAAITAKLNRIIIPKIDLHETTIREAVDFLKQRSKEFDTSPDKKGVNIVLKLEEAAPEASTAPASVPAAPGATTTTTTTTTTTAAPGAPATAAVPGAPGAAVPTTPVVTPDTVVDLSLNNVPLIEALRYLTELAGLKYKIEPYAVSIVPLSENTDEMVTKEYRVPASFFPTASTDTTSATPTAGGAAAASADTMSKQLIGARVDAKKYLMDQGVPFPDESFAQYIPAGSRLIVRNTQSAIDTIDLLVQSSQTPATQVAIESKFVDIQQNNLKELGFDWLLGPFALSTSGVYASGGSQGYNQSVDPSTYPFVNNGVAVGQNPVTGGLRSGVGVSPNSAITANSIDSLLGNVATGAAPGIFGIAGIFNNVQFQMVIRALNQKTGLDLLSAPKVTTKSGQKATVKVVQEFPYPTEFQAPQPPPATTSSSGGSTVVGIPTGSLISNGIVTPTTPTQFEVRNLGVTLEVQPVIGPDNYTIDLDLSPEVVQFDGFINYGSPILSAIYEPLTRQIVNTTLSPNVINQPIFDTRKVTTSVSIWDGQTVAMGGLITEQVQKTEDKVPILGDIPIAGRLFRSDSEQKIKEDLIVFVTARLIDAEGRPVRMDEEQEEAVQPLGLPEELPPPNIESKLPSSK